MIPDPHQPLSVLFLCTQNSARSQIAEALLNQKAMGRLVAGSAGTHPAPGVHPLAIQALARRGIEWSHGRPKTIDAVEAEHWDFVITVCDRARESCPILPGRPVSAHWGIPDPAAVEGPTPERERAFDDAVTTLARRIDLMLALPLEKLGKAALRRDLGTIGTAGAGPEEPSSGEDTGKGPAYT